MLSHLLRRDFAIFFKLMLEQSECWLDFMVPGKNIKKEKGGGGGLKVKPFYRLSID